MMAFTDMAGLAGCAVALAALAIRLPVAAHLPVSYRRMLASVVIIIALVPFGGLALAADLRAVVGDLSISSLLLLLISARRLLHGCAACLKINAHSFPATIARNGAGEGGMRALLLLAVFAALVLYPMALGLTSFDPYRLGYGNQWFLGGLMTLALTLYFRGLWLPAFAIALGVLAWAGGWYESVNLWDYLLDPMLACYATGALLKHAIRALAGRY